jgi:acetyltransferase-like isoleucine patch superfamily enzyme
MREEFLKFIELLIRPIDGKLGRWIRYIYYRKRLGSCGKHVVIEPGVFFQNPAFIFLGNNLWIDRYAILVAGPFSPGGRKFAQKANPDYNGKAGELLISNGCHIAPFTLLQAHAGLYIGKNVTIASGAKVYTLSHHYKNVNDPTDTRRYSFSSMAPPEDQFLIAAPVVIEDDAAVGLNSVVLPGTTISKGSWLGVLGFLQGTTEPDKVYVTEKARKKQI